MCQGTYQDACSALLKRVILIERQQGATGPMATSGSGADDRTGDDARPGTVWAEATDGFNRWVAGEAAGLDDLVTVMTPVLWHVVRAYRLPESAAEDVIQNTWLALVRRRAAILDPVAVGGWLTTTARREAWKVAKATGRALPVEDDELARRLPDEGSAEAEVVRRDGDERLWVAGPVRREGRQLATDGWVFHGCGQDERTSPAVAVV